MARSPPQVGFLVPLSKILEDDTSLPKLKICQGPNFLGRDCIPASDKRLSRKHVMIEASNDGFADVLVEGMNPIVVRSQGHRKKIFSQERAKISYGDIIELIPGHYFFKYVPFVVENNLSSPRDKKRSTLNCSNDLTNSVTQNIKKKNKTSDDKALAKNLQSDLYKNSLVEHSIVEAICNFNVSKEKIPLTFRLLQVQGLPAWANTSSVSIDDVIRGNILLAILSNYMVDVDWLISACPTLKKIAQVLVVHGESDGLREDVKRHNLANWILHKPPLPISYGTHHSKAMFLVYPRGLRVIIHTANLINVDWNNKSQGLWMQDFPWKDQSSPSKVCGFETDLIDYFRALKWPEFTASFPGLGNFNINASFFKKFDYSNAAVRLIGSVPGYHSGPNLKKWGHAKMRDILQECIFDKKFQKSPLVYQFSSLGSLDEKWMAEFVSSMSSGVLEDKTPLGLGEPLIIWPSVEDVRCSLEGYAAGSALPSPLKNVEKAFLKKYWAKWKASHTGRCRAMPHIKTFTRYSGQELAWFLLTSANLSKAAWGALQKNSTQLMIRSYELGVLFIPSVFKHDGGFSCTDDLNSSKIENKCCESSSERCELKRTKLVTLAWQGREKADSSPIFHGHGKGNIRKRMSMVKFGRGMFRHEGLIHMVKTIQGKCRENMWCIVLGHIINSVKLSLPLK